MIDDALETLLYELDAIPDIKAERDAWKQAHDEQVAKLIEIANERDALKAELSRPESTAVSLMRAENAALKDAARLALDALVDLKGIRMNEVEHLSVLHVIAALKAVL